MQLRLVGNAESVGQGERQPGLAVLAMQANALVGLQLAPNCAVASRERSCTPYCMATRSKPQCRS